MLTGVGPTRSTTTPEPRPAKAPDARRVRAPAAALVLLSVVSVQVGQAFGKQLFSLAGPFGVASLRLSIAACVLLLFCRPRPSVDRRSLGLVLAFGTAIAGMNIIYPALQYLPLGVATALQLTGPLTLALLASRRRTDLAWTLLAVTGVALFYAPGAPAPPATGVLLALSSGLAMGAYLLLSQRAGSQTVDGSLLALAVACAALILLPFGVAESGTALLDWHLLLAATGLALVSAVLPYSLDLSALRRLPARVVGVLESLEPAVAGLAGLLVLHEHLGLIQWSALACVTAACTGAVLNRR
jgi:threonine/homoserine efflux transporter RhtA